MITALLLLLTVVPGSYRISARASLEGRVQRALVAAVTGYIAEANVRAGDLVRTASGATGSGGGGKPHLARGGVGDAARVEDAIAAAVRVALDIADAAGGS